MTNISSGVKRTWDTAVTSDTPSALEASSSGAAHNKKSRGSEVRDWRDVHLRTSSSSSTPASAPSGAAPANGSLKHQHSSDRRTSDSRSIRKDYEHDYRRGERRRDGERERERERDRDRDRRDRGYRERDHSRRRDKLPSSRNGDSPRSRPPRSAIDDEKEEGEISPRPIRLSISPPPSARTISNPPITPTELSPSTTAPSTAHVETVEMELDLPPSPPPVEDILAARRAKRQAILAKYSGLASNGVSPSPGPSSAVQPPPASSSNSDLVITQTQDMSTDDKKNGVGIVVPTTSQPTTPGKRQSLSVSPTPGEFALSKDDEQETVQGKLQSDNGGGVGDQISAADYDPSLDRREDEQKRVREPVNAPETIEEDVDVEDDELEDEVDDMFAAAMGDKPKKKKVKKVLRKTTAPALITTTLDSAADPEGYYSVILGEQLDGGRYQVFSSVGKGMFANVVRARILQPDVGEVGKEVAIKIVRCQESMHRAGLKEVQILNKLKQADPDDKKHIVRLDRTFEHRGHLCLVFESLSMNLRDVVKRFGKDVGLNILAVRAYAHQLFLALSLLRKCNIMHADIKPDNILVNEQKSLLKLCDLGSASDASENDITPYLVSRFYRAPEIILGVPYDPSLDIWSIGCTLFELYTGKILFPGRSNNQMLLLMMELKGRFNSKMIKKAKFGDMYFDDMGGFESVEKDRVTGLDVVRKVHVSKPARDLRSRVMPPSSVKLKDDENKLLVAFVDLLDKCLALDPARRITPREALTHPFIRG